MTPSYMLPERADGRRPGVIYADGLEGAFRRVQAWHAARSDNARSAGAVVDLAA